MVSTGNDGGTSLTLKCLISKCLVKVSLCWVDITLLKGELNLMASIQNFSRGRGGSNEIIQLSFLCIDAVIK